MTSVSHDGARSPGNPCVGDTAPDAVNPARRVHNGTIERDDALPEPPEPPEPPETTEADAESDSGAGSDAHAASDAAPDPEAGRFDRWRRESALGAVGTGVARGLQAVFAPPREEPAIVAAVPGDPPGTDGRLRVILDPDDPTKAVAIVGEEPDPPTA